MSSSSNMVATKYTLLPPQNKPEEWIAYQESSEAQADADGILVVLNGAYPAKTLPTGMTPTRSRAAGGGSSATVDPHLKIDFEKW